MFGRSWGREEALDINSHQWSPVRGHWSLETSDDAVAVLWSQHHIVLHEVVRRWFSFQLFYFSPLQPGEGLNVNNSPSAVAITLLRNRGRARPKCRALTCNCLDKFWCCPFMSIVYISNGSYGNWKGVERGFYYLAQDVLELTMCLRQPLNSPSSCLSFLSTGIIDKCYHAPLAKY